MSGTASARPSRLKDFGTTSDAVGDGLVTRAGHLRDDWERYQASHGADWRFDFGDIPDALEALAATLARIGRFTRAVGLAFEEADDGSGVARSEDDEIHGLLGTRWQRILDDSTACAFVDWGDPDDPPEWLLALQTTSMAFGHTASGGDALTVAFVQAYNQYVRVGGPVRASHRYAPGSGGRALLGRFGTAPELRQFNAWFGGAADVFGGFAAGLEQWSIDSASLNYTDDEQLRRALIRGGGTAVLGTGAGLGGTALAATLCGPGAPVCAGVVIIGTGLVAAGASEWLLDRFVDDPDPGEHDPELVEQRVETGGDYDNTLNVDWDARAVGTQVAMAQTEQADALLQGLAIDPEYVETAQLPSHVPVIDYRWDEAVDWLPTGTAPSLPETELTPEMVDAIERYERSVAE